MTADRVCTRPDPAACDRHGDLFDPAVRLEGPPPPAPPGDATRRRGYPLPTWAHEGRQPTGEELERWIVIDLTMRERIAYLEAMLERTAAAQDRAAACLLADHVEQIAEQRAELTDVREQMVDQGLALVDARLAVRDAWRAGYTQRLEDLLGPAGRMPDAEPLLVVVPLTRSAVLTMDPAHVAALAAEAAELALTNRRAELDDEDLDDLTLHVCGRECRPGR